MKHTEGPWKMNSHSQVMTREEFLIAEPTGRTEEEQKANAALIAAAPSMLKLLEDMLDRSLLKEPAPHGFESLLMSVIVRARNEV